MNCESRAAEHRGYSARVADMEADKVTSHEDVTAKADWIVAEARQKRAARQ